MPSDPTPQVYRPPIAIVKCVVSMMVHHIKHQLWQLLLINTPTFDVPPGCHIVVKHLNNVFSAGGCMKWPAASISTMDILTMMGRICRKCRWSDGDFTGHNRPHSRK